MEIPPNPSLGRSSKSIHSFQVPFFQKHCCQHGAVRLYFENTAKILCPVYTYLSKIPPTHWPTPFQKINHFFRRVVGPAKLEIRVRPEVRGGRFFMVVFWGWTFITCLSFNKVLIRCYSWSFFGWVPVGDRIT